MRSDNKPCSDASSRIISSNSFWCLCAAMAMFFSFSLSEDARAQDSRSDGDVGLGVQLGEPSGLRLKFFDSDGSSFSILAAWDLDDFIYANAHLEFEYPLGNEPALRYFLGPGVFVGMRDRGRGDDVDVVVGVSGTFGLLYLIERFEIHARLTPRLSLIPETHGDLGGGFGFVYYFGR